MFEGSLEQADLRTLAGTQRFATILADPPWQFQNRTGKMAPEHRRLSRYATMSLDDICAMPVADIAADTAHLYLWVPNALLPEGLRVMQAWGFNYKSNIVWHKLRKDGGSDGRGVGFYFRNVTEILLFGVRGKNARTLQPGRTQVNYIGTRKREHSRKPDEQYEVIESCSPGPFLELFARGTRPNWTVWGNQADDAYTPTWDTYAHHSRADAKPEESAKAEAATEAKTKRRAKPEVAKRAEAEGPPGKRTAARKAKPGKPKVKKAAKKTVKAKKAKKANKVKSRAKKPVKASPGPKTGAKAKNVAPAAPTRPVRGRVSEELTGRLPFLD